MNWNNLEAGCVDKMTVQAHNLMVSPIHVGVRLMVLDIGSCAMCRQCLLIPSESCAVKRGEK